MINVEVVQDNNLWRKKIKKPEIFFKKIISFFPKSFKFKKKKISFTILLSKNNFIKKLNYQFRKKNKPTDVLSFPTKEFIKKNVYIGDMAISFEIINKRSKTSNFFLEFDKIWIHGYFHLIGYDHKKLKDFKNMTKKENLVLKHFHKVN